MTGAPAARRGQTPSAWSKSTETAADGAVSSSAGRAPGRLRPPARATTSPSARSLRRRAPCSRPGHLGVLANQGVASVIVHPAAAGRRAVDRRRARHRAGPAPPRQDPRRQPPHPAGAGPPRGLGRPSTSGSSGTTRLPSRGAARRRPRRCDAIVTSGGVSVGDLDLVKVVLEKTERGDDALDAGGHPAGQAVRLRHAGRVGASRSSGSRATRCRPWSASSCSSARPCGSWAATDCSTGPSSGRAAEADLRRQPDGKTHFLRARLASIDRDGVAVGPPTGRPGVPPAAGHGRGQCAGRAARRRRGRRPAARSSVLLIDPDRLSADSTVRHAAMVTGVRS